MTKVVRKTSKQGIPLGYTGLVKEKNENEWYNELHGRGNLCLWPKYASVLIVFFPLLLPPVGMVKWKARGGSSGAGEGRENVGKE